jgi:NADH dehydrogenase/NADH:ubiquinone oxidoreductase subunit G
MEQITLEINGKSVQAAKGATILQAAKAAGIKIPTLCDDDRLW